MCSDEDCWLIVVPSRACPFRQKQLCTVTPNKGKPCWEQNCPSKTREAAEHISVEPEDCGVDTDLEARRKARWDVYTPSNKDVARTLLQLGGGCCLLLSTILVVAIVFVLAIGRC
jgi:hypothetical protein